MINQNNNQKLANFTNRELYNLCQQCGSNIQKLQKEFASYLPEVEKRKLYKQYRCHTLYEFAAKLAGMKQDTVDDIMNVHKKLEDKPLLQGLISTQGWSKVKVVATIASTKTEKFWAEKVEAMGKQTLKTFVKELRKEAHEVAMNGQADIFAEIATQKLEQSNGQPMTNEIANFTETFSIAPSRLEPSKPMDTSQKTTLAFKLDGDTETKLKIFKQRLEKKSKEPQDWNQTIKKLLEIVEEHELCTKPQHQKPQRKNKTAQQESEAPQANDKTANQQKILPTKAQIQATLPTSDKRYIPARVKNYLHHQYQGRCVYPQCKSPSEILHHTKRFSLKPNHNPDYIVPLCKPHERLAHHGLIKNEESNPQNWKMQLHPNQNSPKYLIDRKVQRYRTLINR